MNYSSLFGVISGLAVLVFGVATSSQNPKVFLDIHGITIVVGGTAAAALMCFPFRFYVQVLKVIWYKFLGNYSVRRETVIREMVDIAKTYREAPDSITSKTQAIKTPFLKDALNLLSQGGFKDEALDDLLEKRASMLSKRYEQDAAVFKTVAKFPPAFGLMGTTLGMISLLQQLGGKDAQKLLGPAMAIGLVATFYGLTLSNLIFIPIAENLTSLNRDDENVRHIVIDGIKMVRKKEHPKVIEEYLKSYLTPSERDQYSANSKK